MSFLENLNSIEKVSTLTQEQYDSAPENIQVILNSEVSTEVLYDFLESFGNRYITDEEFVKECTEKKVKIYLNKDVYIGVGKSIKDIMGNDSESDTILRKLQNTCIINLNNVEKSVKIDLVGYRLDDNYKNKFVEDFSKKIISLKAKKAEKVEKAKISKSREKYLLENKDKYNKVYDELNKKILILCADDDTFLKELWKSKVDNPNEYTPYFIGPNITEKLPYNVCGTLHQIDKAFKGIKFDVVHNENCPHIIMSRMVLYKICNSMVTGGKFLFKKSNQNILKQLDKKRVLEFFAMGEKYKSFDVGIKNEEYLNKTLMRNYILDVVDTYIESSMESKVVVIEDINIDTYEKCFRGKKKKEKRKGKEYFFPLLHEACKDDFFMIITKRDKGLLFLSFLVTYNIDNPKCFTMLTALMKELKTNFDLVDEDFN